ncbi:MAG: dehydrogenase, partial [Candidatus Meridianibacter frigidus]
NVGGFWIIDVPSKAEAIEWISRAPFAEGDVEIRQIAEAADFGEEFTPELRAHEEGLRAKMERA